MAALRFIVSVILAVALAAILLFSLLGPIPREKGDVSPEDESVKISAEKLRKLGLAIHYFHDANGRYPTDHMNQEGKPILSWRYLLLPYLALQR
jgi:beta-lactam-binding protein with PASTA domain